MKKWQKQSISEKNKAKKRRKPIKDKQKQLSLIMQLLTLLAALSSILHPAPSLAPAASVALSRLDRWVRSGLQVLQWDQLDRCLRMSSMSEADCRRLSHLPLSSVAVYMSEQRSAAGRTRWKHRTVPDSWHRSNSCSRLQHSAEWSDVYLLPLR